MALEVSIDGAQIPNIEPGWSVSEYATPVSPAESAGGTGGVSFGIGGGFRSNALVTKNSTCTISPLGSISGWINSASGSRLAGSFSQNNALAKFDADFTIPPLYSGHLVSALDLMDQMTGTTRLNQSAGAFFSMAGHGVGFNGVNEMVPSSSSEVEYTYYNSGTGLFQTDSFRYYRDLFTARNYIWSLGNEYAVNPTGDSFQIVDSARADETFTTQKDTWTKNRIALKCLLNGQNFSMSFTGGPDSSILGTGQTVTVSINYATAELTTDAEYRLGGSIVNSTQTVPLTGINKDAEIALFVEFGYNRNDMLSPPLAYTLFATACNTSDYSTVARASVRYLPDGNDGYFTGLNLVGNIRSIWRSEAYRVTGWDGSFAPFEWENVKGYAVSGTPTPGTSAVSYIGNGWQYLQEACSAYGWELALVGDVITARPVGQVVLDVSNNEPGASTSASSSYSGRQVNVEYSRAAYIFNQEVYDARRDNNTVLSVGVDEISETTLTTGASLTAVLEPRRRTTPGEQAGTYHVIDSTGLPIVADQWEDYGGGIAVRVGDDPTTIAVSLIGPIEEIPSTTAPYSLAVSDGVNQYAALNIIGTGVLSDYTTLELLTGSDPSKTKQQVATTIKNAFIASISQAYDRGIWASVDASGPIVTLEMDIPNRNISGLGLAAGSVLEWEGCKYRVISANISLMNVTLSCVRHVTVADFDAVWGGLTVADHDLVWDSHSASEQKVLPLIDEQF